MGSLLGPRFQPQLISRTTNYRDAHRFTPAVALDDYRPTAGPDFIPTAEEEAWAAEQLNGDSGPTDAEWDLMAEESAAMDAHEAGNHAF